MVTEGYVLLRGRQMIVLLIIPAPVLPETAYTLQSVFPPSKLAAPPPITNKVALSVLKGFGIWV